MYSTGFGRNPGTQAYYLIDSQNSLVGLLHSGINGKRKTWDCFLIVVCLWMLWVVGMCVAKKRVSESVCGVCRQRARDQIREVNDISQNEGYD